MKSKEIIINPVQPAEGVVTALDVALDCYKKWKSDVPLANDILDYMRNGLVIARPDIFGLAKIVEWNGQFAWFVRIAVGDLRTLIGEIPLPLPFICFCRRGELRIRAYPLERLMKLAGKFGLGGAASSRPCRAGCSTSQGAELPTEKGD